MSRGVQFSVQYTPVLYCTVKDIMSEGPRRDNLSILSGKLWSHMKLIALSIAPPAPPQAYRLGLPQRSPLRIEHPPFRQEQATQTKKQTVSTRRNRRKQNPVSFVVVVVGVHFKLTEGVLKRDQQDALARLVGAEAIVRRLLNGRLPELLRKIGGQIPIATQPIDEISASHPFAFVHRLRHDWARHAKTVTSDERRLDL